MKASSVPSNAAEAKIMQRWWKIAKWMFKAGVSFWFLALPLMPIYGWLRPWPQAAEALRSAGVNGVPVMVSGGSSARHSWSSAGHVWREEEKRSFVVLPESFRDWEIFTYFELRGSGIEGTKTGVATTPMLIPLLAMWVSAGLFSMRTFRQLRAKKPNKAPEPTTTAVTRRAFALWFSRTGLAAARRAPAVVVAHL